MVTVINKLRGTRKAAVRRTFAEIIDLLMATRPEPQKVERERIVLHLVTRFRDDVGKLIAMHDLKIDDDGNEIEETAKVPVITSLIEENIEVLLGELFKPITLFNSNMNVKAELAHVRVRKIVGNKMLDKYTIEAMRNNNFSLAVSFSLIKHKMDVDKAFDEILKFAADYSKFRDKFLKTKLKYVTDIEEKLKPIVTEFIFEEKLGGE